MHDPTQAYLGNPLDFTTMIAYAPGAIVSKTILDKDAGTITLFAFDAGHGLSEHTAPYDAFIHVLDGRLTATVDGTPHDLATGAAIILPANRPHAVKALTQATMMLVMIRA